MNELAYPPYQTILHAAQMDIAQNLSRFNVIACGRRFGKTMMGIDLANDMMLEGYPVGWFSPTYKMLLDAWRELVRIIRPFMLRKNVQERRIETVNDGALDMWSLDSPDTARGRKYARVIIDEAAMIPNLMDTWQHVIRPMLVDYQGDAFLLSTPKGRNGFWQMFQWGADDHRPEWASWQIPTSHNPYIPVDEISAMRETMPERIYRQEILAEFLDDAGGLFRGVVDSATAVAHDSAQDGSQYVAGVDWGRSNDFTVFAVMDITTNELVYLDRFTRIDYETQLSRFRGMVSRFKPTTCIVEDNAMGGPLVERLQVEGFPVLAWHTSRGTKETLIRTLEAAFDHQEIKILNDPILIGELQAYEQHQMTGYWKFGAPQGMHDDTVIALALAWYGSRRGVSVALADNPFYQ